MGIEIDYKDSYVIQPLNFIQFDNDTKSSLSTPQNEERRISKGRVVVEEEQRFEAAPQTELDIDAFFSDLLEFREQENKIEETEPTQLVEIDQTIEPVEPLQILEPTFESRRYIKDKVNHAKKATESIKKIVRLFRKYIKDSDLYHSRSIEEYFTCTRFTFSQEEFQS